MAYQDDQELVARLLRGEAAAFATLLDRHHVALHRTALALAVNEANQRVLLHRARVRLRASLLHHRATS